MGLLIVVVGTGLDVTRRMPRASLRLWEGDPLRRYPRHRPGITRAKRTQWCIRVGDEGLEVHFSELFFVPLWCGSAPEDPAVTQRVVVALI